ncbi:MAG: hypothetical protein COU83_02095 [Candidatus Portnoybacteria bacterium CG10_big_fil_rev_8_21_14_0_10_40_22]|uniref:Uncharacterized protein n=1 Tax=Candidatus Portnoybacteria bacterium CG10_big_fil_rev_8_21_14_0_10_40_22 TaxID=1974814 RepID=A0A2M8KFN8_9BACT|nr:MAG: hypothetical protein COU83_02095 [Candidatus Portnoybacteria bacterium CG10_big_fil_rev_8_21_14_0_10_40_22]
MEKEPQIKFEANEPSKGKGEMEQQVESQLENKENIEKGILHNKFVELAKNPSQESLDDFVNLFRKLEQKIKDIMKVATAEGQDKYKYSSFVNGCSCEVVLFYFQNIPENEKELQQEITKALKGKKVLEIGASRNPHMDFKEYGADYYVAERKGSFYNDVKGTEGAIEELYKEKGIKLLPTCDDDEWQNIPKIDFDIICSTRVWYDGDCRSYHGFDDGGGEAFNEYHKLLKDGGLIYHDMASTERGYHPLSMDMYFRGLGLVTFVRILEKLKKSDIWSSRYYSLPPFGMKLNKGKINLEVQL